MTARRVLGVVLELAMLAASLRGAGPLAESIRVVAMVVVAALGALVMFIATLFAVALLDQRRPPYPL